LGWPARLLIVINEVNPGGGTDAAFDPLVEGFETPSHVVPDPSSLSLVVCVGALLGHCTGSPFT
jgi:hypothetical protein